MRTWPAPILAPLIGLLIASCGGSARSTSPTSPLSYNRSPPLDARVHEIRTVDGVQLRSVTYTGSSGEPVPALFAVPEGRHRAGPCLIYQGGIGATKEQAEFLFPGLVKLGFGVLTIDPRFTGARGSQAALTNALNHPRLVVELLRGTTLDLRRGLDYLDASGLCDRSRIGFAGVSFGGLIGTLLAGSDTRVRAAVLMSIGGDFPTILSKPSFILPEVKRTKAALAPVLRELAPYDPTYWVRLISPRPVLFINGLHDPDVSVASARLLQRAARQPKQVFFDTGGHDPYTAPDVAEVSRMIAAFFRRYVTQ